LTMCVNYGGGAGIAPAAAALPPAGGAGRRHPRHGHARADWGLHARPLAPLPAHPPLPALALFVRSSGENRTSNFLLWQSAYAELVFLDTLWPDFDRRPLWAAGEEYASRQRRFGSACPAPYPVGADATPDYVAVSRWASPAAPLD